MYCTNSCQAFNGLLESHLLGSSCKVAYVDLEASLRDKLPNCVSVNVAEVTFIYHGPNVQHLLWLALQPLKERGIRCVSFGAGVEKAALEPYYEIYDC